MKKRSSKLPLILALAAAGLVLSLCFLSAGGWFIWQLTHKPQPATPVRITPTAVAPNVVAPSPRTADIETQIYTTVYQQVAPSVVSVQVLDEDMLGSKEHPHDIQPFLFSTGEGSGFVIDSEGHIITNHHVIDGAESVVVTFYDGVQAPAEIVGSDPDTDIAVIQIDPRGLDLRPVQFGSIDDLTPGDRLLVIGNPFGNASTLTTGIVSALGRLINLPESVYSLPEVIQTDAAINPGNSGGPMLNARGQVVGVTFMLQSETRSNSGIGFGIPAYFAQRVSQAIIQRGAFQHPYIGIRGMTLSPFIARELDLPVERGVLVEQVVKGSPAAQAGLQGATDSATIGGMPIDTGGDVIVAINDQPVQVFDDLLAYLGRYASPGDTVTLTIYRGNEMMQVPLTLAPRP